MEKARCNTELYSNLRAPLNNVKPSNFLGSHHLVDLIGSGGGNRTARPSGYEPDELPTALPRDIGLQIYGHFLKLQILFAVFA